MTTNQQNREKLEKWFEKFIDRFCAVNPNWKDIGITNGSLIPPQDIKPLIDFIHSTRQSAAQEGYEKGRQDERRENMKEALEIADITNQVANSNAIKAATKKAREEVIDMLKKITRKNLYETPRDLSIVRYVEGYNQALEDLLQQLTTN